MIVFFDHVFPSRRARYIKWKDLFQEANRAGCPLLPTRAAGQ
jgi:hypothetical protein